MIHLEGTSDPGRREAESRSEAAQRILTAYRGQRVSLMPEAQRAQLLEAIAEWLGLADADGTVR